MNNEEKQPMQRKTKVALAAAAAAAFAAPMEGLRQWAYYDPPGILTVCYGSTTNVVKDKMYSLEECKLRLTTDMTSAVETVDRCHPGLPMPVLVAFSDAVYNMGPTVACNAQASTAARLLAVKQYEAACDQLPRWNKARVGGMLVPLPGLTKRRAAEQAHCLTFLNERPL